MTEAQVIQHLHGILVDLRRLQMYRYPQELNNPAEKL